MAERELSLPETAGKYGLLGILAVGAFKLVESLFSYHAALNLAIGGVYAGAVGAAVWGIRKIGKLFAKKEAS